jgi:dUTP pyrophosphatase
LLAELKEYLMSDPLLHTIGADKNPLLGGEEIVKSSKSPIAHETPVVAGLKYLVRMEVKLEHPKARLPFRARTTDAGYDIYSVETIVLLPGRATKVNTGIRLSAPPGYYYTIEGRSSLWSQGIIPNRGIIDSTFCGEIIVSLVNFTDKEYLFDEGQRIAEKFEKVTANMVEADSIINRNRRKK